MHRHLQPEGEVYGHTIFGRVLEERLQALTQRMAQAATDPADAAFRQDYLGIARDLGLTQLNALGYSSLASHGGFENRIFFSLAGPREGIWTLFGGAPHAFDTVKYAPGDADLFMESDIDVESAAKSVLKVVARIWPEKAAEFAVDKLSDTDSTGTLRAVLGLKGRITLVFRAGHFSPLVEANANAQQPLAVFVRVDGIADPVRKALEKSKWVSKKQGSREVFVAPDQEQSPFRPAVAFEGKAVLASLSEEFLLQCLSQSGPGLASAAQYQSALKQFGETGNSICYVSPKFFTFLRETLSQLKANPLFVRGANDRGSVIDYVIDQLQVPSQPVVSVSANLPEGILSRSWSPRSLSTQQFAINLLNPELFGDILNAGVLAGFEETRQSRVKKQQHAAVEENLKAIDAAARAYFAANAEANEVTFAQLTEANPALAELKTHAGESYADLVVERASDLIEVGTSGYETVRYVRPLTPEETAAIQANLAKIDEAAALFFSKNPTETTMSAYEGSEYVAQVPSLLTSIAGEYYSSVSVEVDATEITVETRGGQQVTYKRDPAIRWKALKQSLTKELELANQLKPAFEAAQKFLTEPAAAEDASASESSDPREYVSLGELVRRELVKLPAAIPETDADYVEFRTGKYEVTGTVGGTPLKVLIPLPEAQRSAIHANLSKVLRALSQHLEKNPAELAVFAGELVGKSKLLPELPQPVVGEDYGLVSLRRGDTAASLTLPTGHTVTVGVPSK
jgi:hypothetical protein